MNRVDRLLALILYLQSRPLSTAEEMAAYFGLSVRTVYRDLAALRETGVPIDAQAGVGYALGVGFHLPPVSFTMEEASALATAGMLARNLAEASLAGHLGSALMKIRAVLPRPLQAQMQRLEEGMGVTAQSEKPPQTNLTLLEKALAQRRVLRFSYQGWGKPRAESRDVEPLGLIHYLDRWHLIAWCRLREDYRDFRTDRMSRVELLPETFVSRPDFSLGEYIRQMPKPELRAKVRFEERSVDRVWREWWLGVSQDGVTEGDGPAGLVLTLATVDWDRLAGWLLSFGEGATVLEPEELRSLLAGKAERAAMHHGKKPESKVS